MSCTLLAGVQDFSGGLGDEVFPDRAGHVVLGLRDPLDNAPLQGEEADVVDV